MIGTKVWLNRYGGTPTEGLIWVWSFPGEDHYTLRFIDGSWGLTRGRRTRPRLRLSRLPGGGPASSPAREAVAVYRAKTSDS